VNGFNNLENENPSNVPMTVEARFQSPFVLVFSLLVFSVSCLVFGISCLEKFSTALETLVMFYPLTHLLSLALFQPNPTPVNFCLGRTSHVTRGISNQRATYWFWDGFPKTVIESFPMLAKIQVYGGIN
jgi:hypothetical protein